MWTTVDSSKLVRDVRGLRLTLKRMWETGEMCEQPESPRSLALEPAGLRR